LFINDPPLPDDRNVASFSLPELILDDCRQVASDRCWLAGISAHAAAG
jgi:hypothetical protein